MEAIGAIASIVGVAGAGAKLSIVLFEFASTVSSAGQEVRQIGIEISLFCSVLKQLQSTLTKAKACRYSLSVIETTAEILDRCQEIFNEIEAIVTGLSSGNRSVERSAESTRKLINNVKWTFKRSKVQLLRTTLESCKVTLHIMLSTLEFAQKIATRRVSTLETEAEDEREETMTRSLIIAHQCTVDTLQRLEEEVFQQQTTDGDIISPPLTPGTPPLSRVIRGQSGHKPSRSFDNQIIRFPFPSKDLASKRASVWINNLIFDNSPLPIGFRRQTWGDAECALFLDQQPYYFLQKWTDQGEYLKELRRKSIEHPLGNDTQETSTEGEDEETKGVHNEPLLNSPINSQTEYKQHHLSTYAWNRSSFLEVTTPESLPDRTEDSYPEAEESGVIGSQSSVITKYNLEGPLGLKNQLKWPLGRPRPKADERSDNSPDSSKMPGGPTTLPQGQTAGATSETVPSIGPGSVEIFKSFRVSMEDPCYKVLPLALKKWNINAPWEQYALYIVYEDKERCLRLDEKPLIVFKQLDQEGKKPMFMLRKQPGGVI